MLLIYYVSWIYFVSWNLENNIYLYASRYWYALLHVEVLEYIFVFPESVKTVIAAAQINAPKSLN